MALGVYKPGQGFYTRVGTTAGAGLLALTGAVWVAQQLAGVDAGVEPIILQGAVAGGLVMLSTIFIYWLIGLNKKLVEFFIAVEGEMQKVNWSTRKEVFGSTWVVIGVSIIITAILFAADLVFSWFFRVIDVLEV